MTRSETQEARESGLFLYQTTKSIWDSFLDLIFPPRCQHCGRVDTHFCDVCIADLSKLPIEPIDDNMLPLSGIISSGIHDGLLQSSVQALKYQGQRHLGMHLAQRLVPVIESSNWELNTIIPVPMFINQLNKRGYNQAKEISIHLADIIGLSHYDNVLIRQSQTQSQVGLTREERIENVREDFTLTDSQLITGSKVLLVDDVRTTGATMATCATVLLQHGASHVYGITVTAAGH